jgi:hypothetical protein
VHTTIAEKVRHARGTVRIASLSSDPNRPDARDAKETVRLDPRDLQPSWPIVLASLEQLSDWAGLALRLGTLALIQECVRELAQRGARRETVARLRALVDALAHMPFDA